MFFMLTKKKNFFFISNFVVETNGYETVFRFMAFFQLFELNFTSNELAVFSHFNSSKQEFDAVMILRNCFHQIIIKNK